MKATDIKSKHTQQVMGVSIVRVSLEEHVIELLSLAKMAALARNAAETFAERLHRATGTATLIHLFNATR